MTVLRDELPESIPPLKDIQDILIRHRLCPHCHYPDQGHYAARGGWVWRCMGCGREHDG